MHRISHVTYNLTDFNPDHDVFLCLNLTKLRAEKHDDCGLNYKE